MAVGVGIEYHTSALQKIDREQPLDEFCQSHFTLSQPKAISLGTRKDLYLESHELLRRPS